MFEALPQYPDHPALEEEILAWWDEERIFERLRERNRGGAHWSFFDGLCSFFNSHWSLFTSHWSLFNNH